MSYGAQFVLNVKTTIEHNSCTPKPLPLAAAKLVDYRSGLFSAFSSRPFGVVHQVCFLLALMMRRTCLPSQARRSIVSGISTHGSFLFIFPNLKPFSSLHLAFALKLSFHRTCLLLFQQAWHLRQSQAMIQTMT